MLILRETPSGEKYLEMSKELGAVLAIKNHQAGLNDKEDESNGKTFERPGSKRCLVKLIEKYLSHLNSEFSSLFQKPRRPCESLNPERFPCLFPSGSLTAAAIRPSPDYRAAFVCSFRLTHCGTNKTRVYLLNREKIHTKLEDMN